MKCSRAGCTADASKFLIWANPKIHRDGRTKTWSACSEHEAFLVEYLAARGFLLESKAVK